MLDWLTILLLNRGEIGRWAHQFSFCFAHCFRILLSNSMWLKRECAQHLTTIRRKSVSSISEFTQDRLPIKGKHGFIFYQGSDEEGKQKCLIRCANLARGA